MRLRYWLAEGGRITLSVFVSSLLYSLLMGVNSFTGDPMDALRTGSMYLLLFGTIMSMALCANVYLIHVNLSLSFGCTRKEAFLGLQVFRLAIAVPVILVSGGLMALAGGSREISPGMMMGAGAAAFLLNNALGGVLGILSTRRRRAFLVAVQIVLTILGTGLVGFALYMLIFEWELQLWGLGILLAVGAALYGLSSAAEWRCLKRLSVR